MNTALLAAGGAIDYGSIFTDLAIILIVAKIAAELFERIRVPAVLGEIIAGIVIGPSMLGLIDPSDIEVYLDKGARSLGDRYPSHGGDTG